MNFDFKNGCKNEFEDNNEKSGSRFKNRVPLKIDFRAEWTHESKPTAWELIAKDSHLCEKDALGHIFTLKFWKKSFYRYQLDNRKLMGK